MKSGCAEYTTTEDRVKYALLYISKNTAKLLPFIHDDHSTQIDSLMITIDLNFKGIAFTLKNDTNGKSIFFQQED